MAQGTEEGMEKLGLGAANSFRINKDILYSTGNYIQYLEINHNGKEYNKESIYLSMYI